MIRSPLTYSDIIKMSPQLIINISLANPEFEPWYPSEILIAQFIIAMGED